MELRFIDFNIGSIMAENEDVPPVRSLKRKLEEIFQCTVCYKTPRPTVLQCPNGHITCHKCAEQSPNCPMCREPLDRNKRIRSLAVEQGPNSIEKLFGLSFGFKNASRFHF